MADVTLVPRAPARVFSRPYLFGPHTDYVVSIGGMLAGLALFFMVSVLGWNALWVWFVWVVTLDTPHFYASYFRTYLDKVERRRSRRLLIASLSVFGVGPAVLLACAALYELDVAQFRLPWTAMIDFISVWAYWHVMRQHYGIMRLYNRKGGETGTAEAKLDAILLYGVLSFAFVAFLMSFPPARERIGLGPLTSLPAAIWQSPWEGLTMLPADRILYLAAALGATLFVTRYLAFQGTKFLRGAPLNLPKLVFLATVVGLHSFMGFSGMLPPTTILAFTAVITIYHDIQYFFVVWFYARNRYGKSPQPVRQYGTAGFLSKSFPLFLVAGILGISLPIWGFGCLIDRVPVCASGLKFGGSTFMGDTAWILAFAWITSGFQMHHYVLDQFIWRPSRNAQLRKELKLES
jgi:hypothetical protein